MPCVANCRRHSDSERVKGSLQKVSEVRREHVFAAGRVNARSLHESAANVQAPIVLSFGRWFR